MSVQSTPSRPAGRSVAAAVTGLVVTLVAFVVVFLSFLLAPLVLFGAALACYLVLRPRPDRSGARGPATDPAPGTASEDGSRAGALGHGFGSGVR